MRKQWWLIFPICFILGTIAYYSFRSAAAISSEKAMKVALSSSEAKAFLEMEGGRFASCATRRAVRPCDSAWATCIDGAWVVEFFVGEACGVQHDGRLGLHLLVDWKGDIVSRFPEKEYFQDPQYCLENYDCLSLVEAEGEVCRNFIYGQMGENNLRGAENCECVANKCSVEASVQDGRQR